MRMKMFRFLLIGGLVVLTFQGLAQAQMKPPDPAPPVKVSITVDSQTLTRDKPAIVTITVENVSGRALELSSRSSFDLDSTREEAVARKHQVRGDGYWSPVNFAAGTPMKLEIIDPKKLKQGIVVGRPPNAPIQFAKDETKTFTIDLTKVLWNDHILGMWPHEHLFDVVPKGSYSLSLELRNQGINVKSNAIEVSVN